MTTSKKLPTLASALALSLLVGGAPARDSEKPAAPGLNATCPVSGKPVDPKITGSYEEVAYAFETEANRSAWLAEREASLYQQVGGKAAIGAAVDLFYTKVLADKRVNHFFEDVSMRAQHSKQKAFLAAALGGPEPWAGKDMRAAHKELDVKEEDFNVIAEHLQGTLAELKVDEALIGKVMAVVASTKNDVLNK